MTTLYRVYRNQQNNAHQFVFGVGVLTHVCVRQVEQLFAKRGASLVVAVHGVVPSRPTAVQIVVAVAVDFERCVEQRKALYHRALQCAATVGVRHIEVECVPQCERTLGNAADVVVVAVVYGKLVRQAEFAAYHVLGVALLVVYVE